MKKNLRSPLVNFYETDKSDVKSYFAKQRAKGTPTNEKSSTGGAAGIKPITQFLLIEDGFYLLQEDGSKLYL